MTTRHGNELWFLFAGQKHLPFADASVGTLGQVFVVTTVRDGQHVRGVPALREVFTLFEVMDGVVRRCATGNPV